MTETWTQVHDGDCLEVLAARQPQSVHLIMTSPPYTDQRKETYGGVSLDSYVDWFTARAEQMARVLRDDGSLVLNIKERVHNGERHHYVHDLIAALRQQGWRWKDEFIWIKENPMPGHWPTRVKDAFERCHHFTRKDTGFQFYPHALAVPAKESSLRRIEGIRDWHKRKSATGSRWHKNWETLANATTNLPSNVVTLAAEARNKGHPAVFPIGLPEFFIRMFTRTEDTVLDPFCGSGTTLVAARALHRRGIGIEISPKYAEVARKRLLDEAAYSHGGLL